MSSKIEVANVVLALPLNRGFSYKFSYKAHKVEIGSVVKVIFKNRERIGVVTEIMD
jgi:primosomal protein N'